MSSRIYAIGRNLHVKGTSRAHLTVNQNGRYDLSFPSNESPLLRTLGKYTLEVENWPLDANSVEAHAKSAILFVKKNGVGVESEDWRPYRAMNAKQYVSRVRSENVECVGVNYWPWEI